MKFKSPETEPQETSTWAFQSRKKSQNQKTQGKNKTKQNTTPEHCPIFAKANLSSTPEVALSQEMMR